MINPLEPLRIIFAGTPEFAAHHLKLLIESQVSQKQCCDYELVGVYTQPDRPAGRGKKLTPSVVKKLALEHKLPVFQPLSLKGELAQAELKSLNADLMIVVAYGLILPKLILDTPTYGCINVHASLLPRWRGAAPIQRAILGDETTPNGDSQTGVTIMQMDVGLDTGDMLHKSTCDILPSDTTASLHDKLMGLGGDALFSVLEKIASRTLKPVVQDDNLANYADKITKKEAQINWSLSADKIERSIRAYNPFPVAYTFFREQRIKIYVANTYQSSSKKAGKVGYVAGEIIDLGESGLVVACGEGLLQITSLQLPGKKAMQAIELVNGYQDFFSVGSCFE